MHFFTKITSFEIHALCEKFMHFSQKSRHLKFTHFVRNSCIFHKDTYFYTIPYFSKIPLFNQKFVRNSRFSSKKLPCFLKNSPFRKLWTLQIPCFSQKIPCFTKFPGFQIFKSLKNTRKNHVFLYKIRLKVYIYRLKTFTKDKGSFYV